MLSVLCVVSMQMFLAETSDFHSEEVLIYKIINYWNESLTNFSSPVFMLDYTTVLCSQVISGETMGQSLNELP